MNARSIAHAGLIDIARAMMEKNGVECAARHMPIENDAKAFERLEVMHAPVEFARLPSGAHFDDRLVIANGATYVPGWRPCGCTLAVASYEPFRYAVHGIYLSERMPAMIVIVPWWPLRGYYYREAA